MFDAELAAMFDLNEAVAQSPRCNSFERLDTFFANQDYGIASESAQRDEDMTEIFISGGRVVRKYKS